MPVFVTSDGQRSAAHSISSLLWAVALVAPGAFAQRATASNPDDGPAEIARTPESQAEAPSVQPEPAEPAKAETKVEPAKSEKAAPAGATPPSASAPALAATTSEPETSGLDGQVAGSIRLSAPAMTALPLDSAGMQVAPATLHTRFRVAPEIRWSWLKLSSELDVAAGTLAGLPSVDVSPRLSSPPFSALELRQLFVEVKYRDQPWVVRAGQQAASWGLGLIANPGKADAEPGEFGEAHFGDLSYRLLAAGRPLFGLGGAFRAIEPAVGVDLVVRDDTADWWAGDRALQGILALRFAVDADRNIGVYTVLRRQRPAAMGDGGKQTDAFVLDVAGKWNLFARPDADLKVGFEVVSIRGTTTQARSDTASRHAISQLGAAAKVAMRTKSLWAYLDWGYASGDHNPFDDRLEGFRFDPDYNVGLVLFDQVLAWQSARSASRAADPMLVGRPPEGVELLPTRGSVANAWYLFPRARYGAADWLDVYGGPLLAFSTARLTDPFNTRALGGGEVLNSLGGRPGTYLGTEIDVGVQARFTPHPALRMVGTLEGGYFLPGDAFNQPGGDPMPPVALGRLRLSVHL